MNSKLEQLNAFYELLSSHITTKRKAHIERVSAERTNYFQIGIEDLFFDRNAGAVARTADALGFQQLHVVERSYNAKVSTEISKGAEKWITVHQYDQEGVDNTQACINLLKQSNIQLVATSPHKNQVNLPQYEPTQPAVFFFGSEGPGLSEQLLNQADVHLNIPAYGYTESYNISVAASLVMYSIRNRFRNTDFWNLSPLELISLKIVWALKSLRNNRYGIAQTYGNQLGFTESEIANMVKHFQINVKEAEIRF